MVACVAAYGGCCVEALWAMGERMSCPSVLTQCMTLLPPGIEMHEQRRFDDVTQRWRFDKERAIIPSESLSTSAAVGDSYSSVAYVWVL
jgi:hypothetical protein